LLAGASTWVSVPNAQRECPDNILHAQIVCAVHKNKRLHPTQKFTLQKYLFATSTINGSLWNTHTGMEIIECPYRSGDYKIHI
jgi:hypothetical protein